MKKSNAEEEEIKTNMVLPTATEESTNATTRSNTTKILLMVMRKNQDTALMPSKNSTRRLKIATDNKKIMVEKTPGTLRLKLMRLKIK